MILLLHAGSVSLAIGQIVASGIPYRLVTNSISYGLAYPDRVIDIYNGRANTLLAQMGMALRRRVCVAVAADGPLGKRVDGFEHKGVEYSIAAGPLVLANLMRARTYLLVGGHEERSMACRIVEGPPASASLETLQAFWGSAIRAEVERLTDLGPENYIQHASSSVAAMTTRRYRPT